MDNMSMERKRASVSIPGQTDPLTRESGSTIRFSGKESTSGKTAADFTANGRTTIWKEWVSTSGQTVDATRVSTTTTRNVGTASTPGQTDASMRVGGPRASSTDLEPTSIRRKTKSSTDCGKTESALPGSTSRRFN